MLESNDYVRRMITYFSKAFDIVDLATVVRKLKVLDTFASIINRIISFLTGRYHMMNVNNSFFSNLAINSQYSAVLRNQFVIRCNTL